MSNIVGTYIAQRKPEGIRQLAVSSTVVDLTDATGGIPANASRALVIVEDANIRWTDDGIDPTTTFGMLLGPTASYASIELNSREQIEAFKAIRVSTDSELNIAYYRA